MAARREEREFLERSLADLDAEHDAGDLSDDDYEQLRAKYQRKLDRLAARKATPSVAPRKPGMVVAVIAFVVAVAIGGGFLLASSVGQRTAGGTITGGIDTLPPASGGTASQESGELQACVANDDASAALDCFQAYTRNHPQDPQGFLEFGLFVIRENNSVPGGNDDLERAGETFLKQALTLEPANVEARLYLAVLYNRLGRQDDADAQLAELDGVDIPADLQPLVALARGGAPTTATP